jgi:hypothetical protein
MNNLEEFRKASGEFLKALPTLTRTEQVESGMKCLAILYVNLSGTKADVVLAFSILDYCVRKGDDKVLEIFLETC